MLKGSNENSSRAENVSETLHNYRGALEGIRVVDFGQVWAGPLTGSLLADLGAEVIHVESKAHRSSVLTQDLQESPTLTWNSIGRNKFCVSLDLRQSEAIEMIRHIVSISDVVFENFAPGLMRRYGLHYEELRKIKPDVVMLSISGAGQSGPFSDLLAYGPSMNAVAGTDSLIGYPDEEGPIMNMWEPDPTGSLLGTYAIMVALHERRRTGRGQFIDLSFLELLTTLNAEPLIEYQFTGCIPRPKGNEDTSMAPHGIYPCSEEDTWVSIAVASNEEWWALCTTTGHSDWNQDPRFEDRNQRHKHRGALDNLLADWTSGQTMEEAAAALQAGGVAAYPVNSIPSLLSDPQEQARQQQIQTRAPGIKPADIYNGNPWKLSDTPPTIWRGTPGLGDHNEQVLGDLMGLSQAEIDRLKQAAVIA